MPGLNVTSEIGALKRVIVHSPGPEVEAMTPKEAEADLYNDIIPLQAMRSEFDVLKAFLGKVCRGPRAQGPPRPGPRRRGQPLRVPRRPRPALPHPRPHGGAHGHGPRASSPAS